MINRGDLFYPLLDLPPNFWLELGGLWGAPLTPGALRVVSVCVHAYTHRCPVIQDRSCVLPASFTLFLECVFSSPGAFGDLPALQPLSPIFLPSLHPRGLGLPARSLCPLTTTLPSSCLFTSHHPQPDSGLLLWGIPMLVTLTWAIRGGLWDSLSLLPYVWLVVLWEKWRIQ